VGKYQKSGQKRWPDATWLKKFAQQAEVKCVVSTERSPCPIAGHVMEWKLEPGGINLRPIHCGIAATAVSTEAMQLGQPPESCRKERHKRFYKSIYVSSKKNLFMLRPLMASKLALNSAKYYLSSKIAISCSLYCNLDDCSSGNAQLEVKHGGSSK